MERLPVSERLKPYVKCIWTLQRTYAGDDTGEVLWPDECKEIIVHHGCVYHVDQVPLSTSFVMGTLSGYRRLEAKGDLLLYGIRLYPWGLYMISDRPVHQFNDRFIPLAQLTADLRAGQVEKLERSLKTADMDLAQSRLEAFLEHLIDPDKADPVLFNVLANLFQRPAEYQVADAVRDLGCSLRHFERRCLKVTGLTPKRLHKIARFNQARIRLLLQPELDLHDLMVEMGYYDYSHFSKDFHECLGWTPAQFQAWACRLISSYGPSRVEFLQDKC